MSVQIIDVRMAPSGKGHEAISAYQWKDESNGTSNWADKPLMVEWVRRNPNQAWVGGPAGRAWVVVVDQAGAEPYLRTMANGIPTDNLLSLPGAQA